MTDKQPQSWCIDAWNQSGVKEVSITVRTSSDKELDDRSLKIVRIRMSATK